MSTFYLESTLKPDEPLLFCNKPACHNLQVLRVQIHAADFRQPFVHFLLAGGKEFFRQ
jgi:hypothetical protein